MSSTTKAAVQWVLDNRRRLFLEHGVDVVRALSVMGENEDAQNNLRVVCYGNLEFREILDDIRKLSAVRCLNMSVTDLFKPHVNDPFLHERGLLPHMKLKPPSPRQIVQKTPVVRDINYLSKPRNLSEDDKKYAQKYLTKIIIWCLVIITILSVAGLMLFTSINNDAKPNKETQKELLQNPTETASVDPFCRPHIRAGW